MAQSKSFVFYRPVCLIKTSGVKVCEHGYIALTVSTFPQVDPKLPQ